MRGHHCKKCQKQVFLPTVLPHLYAHSAAGSLHTSAAARRQAAAGQACMVRGRGQQQKGNDDAGLMKGLRAEAAGVGLVPPPQLALCRRIGRQVARKRHAMQLGGS